MRNMRKGEVMRYDMRSDGRVSRDADAIIAAPQCLLVGCQATNGVISDWVTQNCGCVSRLAVDPDRGELEMASLILIDLGSNEHARVVALLTEIYESSSEARVALLNVRDLAALDGLLEWPAVRGMFTADLKPAVLIDGIREMLNDGYWLPRESLHRFLSKRQRSMARQVVATNLTRRERQILGLLAHANTNQAIADQLCVSEHTVKTHLYRTFKKIHAKNRMEAMRWAQAHCINGAEAPY